MLPEADSLEALYKRFRWDTPDHYNIGVDVCDRWAATDPDRLAVLDVSDPTKVRQMRFGGLRDQSNRLANALAQHLDRGDRVGILLSQRVETALAHIAALKLGAVSLPLFKLFGPDALLHRLQDSQARIVITDADGAAVLQSLRAKLPELGMIISVDGPHGDGDVQGFDALCAGTSSDFEAVNTRSDDPAILIYTSGTTGNPKGALLPHHVLLGHLPGVEMSHNLLPRDRDRLWTPADWAWIGGLLDVLMPGLHHGICVVACRFEKFTAEAAFALMRDHKVRNAFLPPTALKIMRQHPDAAGFGLKLRSVASGGETLGAELLEWGEAVFGTPINEFYGQTECNMIVSSCAALAPPEPGVMGFPVPGHAVAVLDACSGERLAHGMEGAIGVLSPDPVMFLEYLGKPEATEQKYVDGPEGRWLLTGDRGVEMPSGGLRFLGRDDDIINSGGYRIGPGEVEDCLLTHDAVQMAGVVGAQDTLRGQSVCAFVVLNAGYEPSDGLANEISAHVKARLAAHEYPRRVIFVDTLPMTTTGKIIRNRLREMVEAG
ncbi:MAG: AMP-binding protein [Pseudomonadota bacterium]